MKVLFNSELLQEKFGTETAVLAEIGSDNFADVFVQLQKLEAEKFEGEDNYDEDDFEIITIEVIDPLFNQQYDEVCEDLYEALEIAIDYSFDEKEVFEYLLDCGYDVVDSVQKMNETNWTTSSAEDYARELVDGYYELSDFAKRYFDYGSFAEDLKYGGDIVELDNVVITNANGF